MSAPRSVVTQMDAVPYIAGRHFERHWPDAQFRCCAGVPDFHLWPKPGTGRAGWSGEPDLAEHWGVTVTVNSLMLLLMFVSPQQINTQLQTGRGG
jgi:hypothetical protein